MTEKINGWPILGPKDFDPENPKPGIYKGIPNEVYHSSSAISASSLLAANKSIGHYISKIKETKAMKLGSAGHAMVLEPEEFAKVYIIQPESDMTRTEGCKTAVEWLADIVGCKYHLILDETKDKAGLVGSINKLTELSGELPFVGLGAKTKTALEELKKTTTARAKEIYPYVLTNIKSMRWFYNEILLPLAEKKDVIILRHEEYETVSSMHKSVWSHDVTKHVFKNGHAELSFFGRLPASLGGWMVRIRPDYFRKNKLISFKTIRCAEDEFIRKQIFQMEYYISEAFYNYVLSECFGINLGEKDHYMIFTENNDQFHTEPKYLDKSTIDVGITAFEKIFQKIADFKNSPNKYMGYGKGNVIESTGLPEWAFTKIYSDN